MVRVCEVVGVVVDFCEVCECGCDCVRCAPYMRNVWGVCDG